MKATASNVFFCLMQHLFGRAYLDQAIAAPAAAKTQGLASLSLFLCNSDEKEHETADER
jgi:hypothetical protein